MIASAQHRRIPRRVDGFTMIEVLVALVVLSIGLLGLAGLQLSAVKVNQNAYQLSQAAWMAYDMADRMRANPDGVALGQYNNVTTVGAGAQQCTQGNQCNATALAAYDLFEWQQALRVLPNGTGTIARAGDVFTLRVMWDGLGNGAAGTGCDPTQPTVDMTCYQIEVEL